MYITYIYRVASIYTYRVSCSTLLPPPLPCMFTCLVLGNELKKQVSVEAAEIEEEDED